ncbi:hypothetical protein, partial [Cellulophaga sp. BC115SP]|uniref:hypothetical protein n=1 Tax=Cellulophaga sp. BC115SP TaxID=2683263 RepID=UPI001411E10B
MYKIEKQIKHVNRLLSSNKEAYYYQTIKNNQFFIEGNNQKYLVNENFQSGYSYLNVTYLVANSGLTFKIDNSILIKMEYNLFTSRAFNSRYVEANKELNYDLENKRWLGVAGVYDLENDKLIETEIGLGFRTFINNFVFFNPENTIVRFEPSSKKYLWTYSFEGYPKVKNQYGKDENVMLHNSNKAFTGVIDKQLWVSLNTSQHLVLDVETGEQLALLGQPYKYNKDYYTQKVMSGGQIDVKQEKIISLGNCQYREINTNNFEATFIDLREEFDRHGVSSVGDTRFDDDYIYFYDKIFFGAQPRNKVAVLDRKTLKVVWVHDFAQYGTFPMQMEKTDRHLLV